MARLGRRWRAAARGLLLGAAALLGSSAGAGAVTSAEIYRSEHTEVALLADKAVAAPGEGFTLALRQRIAPGWHTYWENAGASGLPTTIAWTAPEGVEIGPIEWPAPSRLPFKQLVNYGYDDQAVLLIPARLPADWPPGAPLTLTARADWLVCRDLCLPEGQDYTITIPTGASSSPDFAAAIVVAEGRTSLPTPSDAPARFRPEQGALVLTFEAPELRDPGLSDFYFYPRTPGVIDPSAPQSAAPGEAGLVLSAPLDKLLRESGAAPESDRLEGVLRARTAGGERIALALTATREAPLAGEAFPAGAPTAAPPSAGGQTTGAAEGPSAPAGAPPPPATLGLGLSPGLGAAALLAFLGGVILNLMPCVFPVLALKAVSLAKTAHKAAQVEAAAARAARLRHGLAYGAGVLASFLAFAGALIALKAAGAAVGWGFQLQTPIVVAALAYALVLVGLNLSGVFELSPSFAGAGQGLTRREGVWGDFFTGVLAALVASPCTAPFMGAALGYAATQDAATALAVFAALGLGFAAPIMLLAASPRVARLVPRPGPWMIRFRQALAFPMYLAAAWLFWVLGKQAGVDALFAALAGAVLLALGAWALGAGYPESRGGRTAATVAALLALLGALWALSPALSPAAPDAGAAEAGLAEPYDAERLRALTAENRPVFVNVTADWCISCKGNEINVLSGERFETLLRETGAAYLKGDWTRRDPAVTAYLQSFGRIGVPLYVAYPSGGGAPIVLPQILSHAALEEALTP